MNREIHVRICGGVGVRFPCATRLDKIEKTKVMVMFEKAQLCIIAEEEPPLVILRVLFLSLSKYLTESLACKPKLLKTCEANQGANQKGTNTKSLVQKWFNINDLHLFPIPPNQA